MTNKEILAELKKSKDLSCMTCCDLEYYWYEDENFLNKKESE